VRQIADKPDRIREKNGWTGAIFIDPRLWIERGKKPVLDISVRAGQGVQERGLV